MDTTSHGTDCRQVTDRSTLAKLRRNVEAPASGNSNDARIVQKMYAQEVIKQTIEAIGKCDKECREILDMLYLQDYTDTMCYLDLGYSESTYSHSKKPKALLQFADVYLMEDLRVPAAES